MARELYDHTGDTGLGAAAFDEYENLNLAYVPRWQPQVAELASALFGQFGRILDGPC